MKMKKRGIANITKEYYKLNTEPSHLVFSTFGGIGYEGSRFLKHLNEKLVEKWMKIYQSFQITSELNTVSHYLRTMLCLRGSRPNKLNKNKNKLEDRLTKQGYLMQLIN